MGWLTEARSVMVTDERAMRHGRRHHAHVRADDHGAGARVDDDARRRIARLDLDLLRASTR